MKEPTKESSSTERMKAMMLFISEWTMFRKKYLINPNRECRMAFASSSGKLQQLELKQKLPTKGLINHLSLQIYMYHQQFVTKFNSFLACQRNERTFSPSIFWPVLCSNRMLLLTFYLVNAVCFRVCTGWSMQPCNVLINNPQVYRRHLFNWNRY